MQDLRYEVPLRLSTPDGREITATASVDHETEAWLRSAAERSVDVEIRDAADLDVSAHDGGDTSVVVIVRFPGGDDDVEGHAMSLRFPTMEAARDFEKRMLAAGALVAVVALGAVGAGVASQAGTSGNDAAAPAAAPAVVQYGGADRDIGLMDPTPQYAQPASDLGRDMRLSAPAAQAVQPASDLGRDMRLSAPQTAPAAGDQAAPAAEDDTQRSGDRRR